MAGDHIMISVYDLKSRFQILLRPICNSLASKGVTANQVTMAALLLSLAYGGLLILGWPIFWLLLPVFLFLRMGLNAIDGMLAREHDMKSRLGMALNELGDVISDTALFLPFLVYAPEAALTICAFIFFAALSEFNGLLAFMMSGTRRYDGPMGKSDRAAATGILGFLIGLGLPLQPALFSIFAILTLLTIWSSFNRLKAAIKEAVNE